MNLLNWTLYILKSINTLKYKRKLNSINLSPVANKTLTIITNGTTNTNTRHILCTVLDQTTTGRFVHTFCHSTGATHYYFLFYGFIFFFQSKFNRQINQSKMVKIVDISCSAKPREIGRDTTSVVKNERNYTFSDFDRCCVRVSTSTIRSISRHLSDWRDYSRGRLHYGKNNFKNIKS